MKNVSSYVLVCVFITSFSTFDFDVSLYYERVICHEIMSSTLSKIEVGRFTIYGLHTRYPHTGYNQKLYMALNSFCISFDGRD